MEMYTIIDTKINANASGKVVGVTTRSVILSHFPPLDIKCHDNGIIELPNGYTCIPHDAKPVDFSDIQP